MTNALNNAARSSGLSFIGSVISAVAGFFLSIVLARLLGPTGSGVVFQMISVFTIATAVAKLGLDTTAVWLLPRLATDGRNDVRRAVWILLIGALAGGAVVGALVFLIAPLLGQDVHGLVAVTRLAALFMPFSSVTMVALAITRGLGGIRNYVLIGSITLPTGRVAAVAVATAFAATALAASSAWLGVLIVTAVLSLIAVRQPLKRFRRADDLSLTRAELTSRIASFSVPRIVSAIIEQALLWLDVLLVGLLAGPTAAGVYGVVSRLVQAGTIPSTSMRIVVAPEFSRMLHTSRLDELSELYARTAQWIVLLSTPIYVLLTVLAPPVLRIFGPGFESGAVALAIMCIGAVVSASTGNVQSLLLMSGRSGWAAVNKVIVLLAMITLLLTLVPLWGLVGAATASSICISLDAVLATVQVRRGARIRSSFVSVAWAFIVAAVATAVPALITRILLGSSMVALVVGATGAIVFWGVALYVTRKSFALDRATALISRKRTSTPR